MSKRESVGLGNGMERREWKNLMCQTTVQEHLKNTGACATLGSRGKAAILHGRPKGSRNKLSEEFVAEVCADWCEHGETAIRTVRETRPEAYVRVVASLLPRQVQAEISGPTNEDRVTALAEKLAQLDAAKEVR